MDPSNRKSKENMSLNKESLKILNSLRLGREGCPHYLYLFIRFDCMYSVWKGITKNSPYMKPLFTVEQHDRLFYNIYILISSNRSLKIFC